MSSAAPSRIRLGRSVLPWKARVVIDGGRWDGVGFRSTGLVGSFPPVVVTVRQTFTKAGAYPYRCLSLPVPPSPCRRRPGGRVRVSVAQAELLHLA